MEITFINPGVDYMVQQIMEFQTEGETKFWSEPLYHFYPQLNKEYAASLSFPERKNYIESILRTVYIGLENEINERTAVYAQYWAVCKGQITAALSDAFNIDCANLFNDLRCNVSINPISPRFLEERCFDVFYLNSERGAIGISIHELVHFVWFHVWNQLYRDNYDEYERPSLKWILSEMVVESVMKDSRLSTINPYFPRENGGCIYPYFFDMEVDGVLILDTLDKMYERQNVRDFMLNSYSYCQMHETEIRNHILHKESL